MNPDLSVETLLVRLADAKGFKPCSAAGVAA